MLGAISALMFGTAMLEKGDAFLAATNAVSFGRTYAGHDVSYFIFELPLQVSVLRLAAFALVLLAIASGGVYFAAEQRRRGSLVHQGDARRAADVVVSVTFVYGGLALVCLGLAYAIDRNSALIGGDDLISRRRQGDAHRADAVAAGDRVPDRRARRRHDRRSPSRACAGGCSRPR